MYVIAAKTFYDPSKLKTPDGGSILSLPIEYFAAHLPLYPALINVFKILLGGMALAYLKSMVLVNLLSTALLACFFYYVLKKFRITSHPMILSIVFLFLPRFLVVRSVGAPESLFMFLILASLYFFEKENYLVAGLLGGLSVATKTPGIILFGAYCLAFVEKLLKIKKIDRKWMWVLLIPMGLLTVFLIYWRQYGDFFAYFHSGDNIHLVFPFSVFNFQKVWIGTAWLEDVIFYFLLYGLTVLSLKDSKHRSFFYFSLLFFIATTFIQHRDIARYSLPLWPMALIAFEKFFTSKKYLPIFAIILVAIYLYAWNFLSFNTMPIGDWKPFL